ncbi:MAG: hypothetical protein KDI30_02370, partial [Pseudomonadales bacterium]|nr:hypothetical protein [Pseudomonadales bacterium]
KGRLDLSDVQENSNIEDEVAELDEYISGSDVRATFTRTRSSEQKIKGYWVAKDGCLTNGDKTIDMHRFQDLSRWLTDNGLENRSLFVSN